MRWIILVHLVPCLLLGCPDTDIEVGPDDDTVADDDDDTTPEPDDDDTTSQPDDDDSAVPQICEGHGGSPAAAVIEGVEYPSFAEAMDAIADGQVLEICPGTHTESIEVGEDRQLTITSYSGDREDTILDGEGVRQIVRIGLRSEVTVRGLTFSGGYGQWFGDDDSCGGAIYTQAASTSVKDCVFRQNLAGAEEHTLGGAVCHWLGEGSGASELTISDSTFEDNGTPDLESLGGALYAYTRDTLTLDIDDCTFTSNTSSGSGGAARLKGSPLLLRISDSWFEGNSNNDGWYGSEGGALQILDWGSIDISSTSFIENTSVQGGGAIDVGSSDLSTATAFIRDCHFEGNLSEEGEGGGVNVYSLQGDVNTFYVEGSSFVENEAYSSGGGLSISNPTEVVVEDCTFEGNVAGGNGGGALEVSDWDSVEITDSAFISNHASYGGGALDIGAPAVDGGVIEIQSSTLEANTSDQDGGAIRISHSQWEDVTLLLRDSTLTTNSAGLAGGAIEVSIDGTADVVIWDSDFTDNSAGTVGGALNLDAEALTFEMARSSAAGNEAVVNGGAIKFFAYHAEQPFEALLQQVTIEDNSVTDYYGGAVIVGSPATVTLDTCTVLRNTGGGALLDDEADAILYSTNTSWGDGADDNTPWDVAVTDGPTYSSYGASETFTCSGDVGCQ